MPDTDQMIRDLVAKGFKLPEGLEWIDLPKPHSEHYKPYWSHNRHGDIVDQQAHDLCAMRWARDRRAWPQLDYDAYHDAMIRGDSAAAIEALWEACGGKQ